MNESVAVLKDPVRRALYMLELEGVELGEGACPRVEMAEGACTGVELAEGACTRVKG